MAEEKWLSRRSSAGVPALAHGDRHRDVPFRQESAEDASRRSSEEVVIPKGIKVRRLHKAFLRYHDPENWPLLREALKRMGRADLIGNGKQHLIPAYQPVGASRALPDGRFVPSTPDCRNQAAPAAIHGEAEPETRTESLASLPLVRLQFSAV